MNEEISYYNELYYSIPKSDRNSSYIPKEKEDISTKISTFLSSLDSESKKLAGRQLLGLIFYYNYLETGKLSVQVPYNGVFDRENVETEFDLKKLPPILARLLSAHLDRVTVTA